MDNFTIRSAVASDAAALASMLDQLGYPTDAGEIPGRLARMAERPGTTVFVAEQGNTPVGVVTVHLFPSLHTSEPVAWLTAVVVDESVRGTGVGSALVKHAEEWARSHGAKRLALTSHLRRVEAHEFYKKREYEHTGVRLAKDLAAHASHPTPKKSDPFHVLEFDHHDEAAAFVAALSRFVSSPARGGGGYESADFWARSPVHR
jgi:GNAT superfamily N-acetyltransferase